MMDFHCFAALIDGTVHEFITLAVFSLLERESFGQGGLTPLRLSVPIASLPEQWYQFKRR